MDLQQAIEQHYRKVEYTSQEAKAKGGGIKKENCLLYDEIIAGPIRSRIRKEKRIG